MTSVKNMGAFGKESVLKLVHPGGFVEIHRRPVKASEVMRKNPRHCVTRPDVFRYPWIVVRPESVLEPGNVFYIVPNHTIYRLIRAYEASGVKPPDARLPDNPNDSTRKDQVCATQNSTRRQPRYIASDHSGESQMIQLPEGSNPKKLGKDRSRPSQAHLHGSRSQPPESTTKPRRSRQRHRSQVISPHDGNDNDDNHSEISIVMQASGSSGHSKLYPEVRVTPKRQHWRVDKVENMKSCLKKDSQERSKPDGLKVRFDLPDDRVDCKKWRVVAKRSQL